MADPVGLTASLITLLGTSYKLSTAIYGAVDSIRAAPTHIKAVAADTRAMFSVIGTLSSYLDDEDNAMGVLHRVVAADLGEVLTNSISVLKELHMLVNEFLKGDRSGQNLESWARVRLHFKEAEVKQWREQLVAHKITLSVAIAMANLVNTNSTEMASKRIEKEVLELKSMVTNLLMRMNAAEELQANRDVIIDNYRSTIRRVARGADSIISEATWERASSGPCRSVVVSSAGVSEETHGSYKTARSIATARPSTALDDADSHKSTDFPRSVSLSDEETSHRNSETRYGNEKLQSIDEGYTDGLQQVFVKGPGERTHAFTFDYTPTAGDILNKIHQRTGAPPDIVSLRAGGRVLTDTATPLHLANGTTLHANINATGMGWSNKFWDYDTSFKYAGLPLDDTPLYTRYLPRRKQSRSIWYWQREPSDGGFTLSREQYYERDVRAQQLSFAILAQGLRGIIARGDTARGDTRSLASGLRSAFSAKRSDEGST